MVVKSVKDCFGRRIFLTQERWQHIITRHPELRDKQNEVLKTVKQPEIIVENPFNKSVNLYHRFDKRLNLYTVVIVEIEQGFIITSYSSLGIKKGEIIWQKT